MSSLFRNAICFLIVACSSVGLGQTTDDEDLIFAAGVLNLKVQQLLTGDSTDRSADFPKSKSGVLMVGIYRSMLRQVVRDAYIVRKMDVLSYYDLVGGRFYDSPKAGLTEVAKVVDLYSKARIAYLQDVKAVEELIAFKDDDTTSIRSFKAGTKDGLLKSKQMLKGRDAYALTLIHMAKVEEALHFLEQNRGGKMNLQRDWEFKDKAVQVVWRQKLAAIEKASVALDEYGVMRGKRIKEVKGVGAGPSISG
jgi:hypothetical protein